jgi:hypothetical protein
MRCHHRCEDCESLIPHEGLCEECFETRNEPKDYCRYCGDPIALYNFADEPLCDCEESERSSHEGEQVMGKLTGITESDYTLPGPAPKREAMTPENQIHQLRAEVKFKTEEIQLLLKQLRKAQHVHTDMRAVYDRAFDAALPTNTTESAHKRALECVRTHAARMAELEKELGNGEA